jgi:cytoskeletal protein CcmA (bactofilin family)
MALFSREPETNRREHLAGLMHRALVQAIQLLTEDARPQTYQAAASMLEAPTAPRGLLRAAHSYLDPGCRVTGELHFEGAARIDGQIDGQVDAKDLIVFGKSAVVTAKISAESVILAGAVSGEITASHCIELRSSAEMQGIVTTPRLIVDDGAVFKGHCSMQLKGAALEPQGARLLSMTPLGQILGRVD